MSTSVAAAAHARQFAADVEYYLSQAPRQLPSRCLYDALGSALFEAICELPWYRITRAEMRLLAAHRDEIFSRLPPLTRIVELGPGHGGKLRLLVGTRQARPCAAAVHLVDLSASALEIAAHTIDAHTGIPVVTHHAGYEDGLVAATARAEGRTLVAFLGSNIGNFDPPGAAAFLQNVRAALSAGDALLLGIDLVKPEPTLLLAYDDPLGVTAAFNRNLLVRINRELGGTFDVGCFAHRAVWRREHSRIEMHLVARHATHVRVPGARLDFSMAAGEPIWTESSYKYHPDDIARLLAPCGFDVDAQWLDAEAAFALTLAMAT
jgi:dimethylhistidine N-methyltransferase